MAVHDDTLICFKKMELGWYIPSHLLPGPQSCKEGAMIHSLGLMIKKSMFDHVLFTLKVEAADPLAGQRRELIWKFIIEQDHITAYAQRTALSISSRLAIFSNIAAISASWLGMGIFYDSTSLSLLAGCRGERFSCACTINSVHRGALWQCQYRHSAFDLHLTGLAGSPIAINRIFVLSGINTADQEPAKGSIRSCQPNFHGI